MTNFTSIGGSSILASDAAALDRNALQTGEQSSWDRQAFDSLFEQRLRAAHSAAIASTGSSFSAIAQQSVAGHGLDPLASTRRTAELSSHGFVVARSQPADAGAEDLSVDEALQQQAGVSAAALDPATPVAGAEAESAAPLTACPAPAADAAGSEPQADPLTVVVQLQDNQVLAAVRLSPEAMPNSGSGQLVNVLRSELSWRGLTLGSLKLNGKEVWRQPAAVVEAGGTVESLENSNGR